MEYLSGLDGMTASYFRWPYWLDRLINASPAWVRVLGTNIRRRRWLETVASLPGIRSADVIHIQGLKDAEAVLTRFSGPLVVTHWGRVGRWLEHGSKPSDNESLLRRIRRIRDNVKLVAIGEAQAEALTSAGMPPAGIIPPGIDLQQFKPRDRLEARRRVALPTDSSIVLFVGRLAADKNVETLLRAFARLSPRTRCVRLLLIGNGPLRAQLQRLSGNLGIDAITTFLPFVPHEELPAYYSGADVTVVPSNYLETFCMVALEAIACRCPLIVTDNVPEILRHFPTVPSVAPYDVEALRDRLDAALDGHVPPADTQMADYDWSGLARRYVDIYQTALRFPT
jgi:glycosyltransferase involved in cell wall biosynthesis